MKTILIITALAALALPAAAESGLETRHVTVKTADLDLSRAADVQTLRSRLNSAVQAACGGAPASRELGEVERVRACTVQAMDQTLRHMDAALAAALTDGPVPQRALAAR